MMTTLVQSSCQPVGDDDDVLGLDIAVDDAARMRGGEPGSDWQKHLDGLRRRHPTQAMSGLGVDGPAEPEMERRKSKEDSCVVFIGRP
jgi:hypothetical protein